MVTGFQLFHFITAACVTCLPLSTSLGVTCISGSTSVSRGIGKRVPGGSGTSLVKFRFLSYCRTLAHHLVQYV